MKEWGMFLEYRILEKWRKDTETLEMAWGNGMAWLYLFTETLNTPILFANFHLHTISNPASFVKQKQTNKKLQQK